MRYHLFQKFCGKMVKIKEMSFLSTRGAVCFALNCILPTHELVILAKFHKDWQNIVDFLAIVKFCASPVFFASVST